MIEYSNVDALLILNAVEGLGLKRKHKLLSIAEPKDLLTDFDRYKPALLKILGTEVFGKLESLRTEETLKAEWQEDWLHPNATGYRVMGEYAAEILLGYSDR